MVDVMGRTPEEFEEMLNAQIAEAEHLKSSAVREDRTVPVHEAMQSARLPHEFHSGAQEEMVGIAEDDPRAEITQLIG